MVDQPSLTFPDRPGSAVMDLRLMSRLAPAGCFATSYAHSSAALDRGDEQSQGVQRRREWISVTRS